MLIQCIDQAKAQLPDYHVRLFDESFGIRTVGLRRMTKDRQDFVWLLYRNRIKRFDGKRITEFFPGQELTSIFCDPGNQVWVSSPTTLYKFGNDHTGFIPVEIEAASPLQLGAVFQLPGKPVWLLTSEGIFAYDPPSGKFRKLKASFPGRPFNTRQYSLSTYANTLFYCSGNKVYCNDPVKAMIDSLPVSEIYSVNALNEKQALVTNWKNQSFLYDFSLKKIQPLSIRKYLPQFADNFLAINDVLNLGDNRHLLASTKGLIEYNSANGGFQLRKLFFKGQPLHNQEGLVDLYMDNNREIWACSDFSVLSFNPSGQEIGLIRNWETDPSRAFSNHVRGFAPDKKGNLWLATINGIAYFDMEQGTIKPLFPVEGATGRMNHPSIRGIVYDGHYVIIGQTNRGIWLYDPVTDKYKRPSFPEGHAGDSIRRLLEDDFIDQLYTLRNGHHVVVARDRTYLLNGKNYRVSLLNFPGSNDNGNFCYEDRKGFVWLGTNNGLYCLDSMLQPVYSVKEGFAGATRCLYQLSDHEYMLGAKGLYLLKTGDKKPSLKRIAPYFDNIVIQTIHKDSTGKLWLATDEGLYRYHLPSGQVDYFDQNDNIQGNLYYQNSYYFSKKGILFLGGFNGINYFKPEAVNAADDSLQVSILHMSVNDDDTSFWQQSRRISLKYSQNTVDIDFTAPYYSNTGRVRYRYRMKGLDTAWISNENDNLVRFSSLPPGAYTFTAAASVNGTRWFETKQAVSFVIRPPFWNTWWFLLLVIAISVMLLYKWIQSLREKVRAERVLNYFATSLYGQNTVEDIFWDVAKNCISQLKFEDCVIYEFDTGRQVLVQKAAYGPKNPGKREIYHPLEIPLGKGIVGAVALHGKAEVINNTRKDKRYIIDDQPRLSELAVPIRVDGKLFGVIDSEHPRKNFYSRRHVRLLSKIADTCAVKISRYIVEERLRSKIARDLHDEMGSTLTSINIISKMAMQQYQQDPATQNSLQRIKDHSARMMEGMSDIVWAINPANDSFERIIIRLKEFAAEILEPLKINYYFNEDGQLNDLKLNPEQRRNFYLIYKESIHNAVKYSEASEVNITLRRENGTIQMLITDNGKGFDTNRSYAGNGLGNMLNRAMELQAELKIGSIPGAGTTIMLVLPLSHDQGTQK